MDRPRPPRRHHVWVDSGGGRTSPGLILAWRIDADGGWEAQVATVGLSSVLVTWTPADKLRPVTDDRPRQEPRER